MVKFQVLTWDSRDENNDHYIRLFGKTLEGKSVCVTTTFKPYFFIKIPVGSSQEALKGIIEKRCTKLKRSRLRMSGDFKTTKNAGFYRYFVMIARNEGV